MNDDLMPDLIIFTIDKNYANALVNKISVFEDKKKIKKQIFLTMTMITTHGVKKNLWSADLVDFEVVLGDLFDG